MGFFTFESLQRVQKITPHFLLCRMLLFCKDTHNRVACFTNPTMFLKKDMACFFFRHVMVKTEERADCLTSLQKKNDRVAI